MARSSGGDAADLSFEAWLRMERAKLAARERQLRLLIRLGAAVVAATVLATAVVFAAGASQPPERPLPRAAVEIVRIATEITSVAGEMERVSREQAALAEAYARILAELRAMHLLLDLGSDPPCPSIHPGPPPTLRTDNLQETP